LESAGSRAYLRTSIRSMSKVGPISPEAAIDAVPSRTMRPSAVIGREVPGRAPWKAVSTRLLAVPALCMCQSRNRRTHSKAHREFVPGRAKPVSGRPAELRGRPDALPGSAMDPAPVWGRPNEVPGLIELSPLGQTTSSTQTNS
jgi:hypothetical protein